MEPAAEEQIWRDPSVVMRYVDAMSINFSFFYQQLAAVGCVPDGILTKGRAVYEIAHHQHQGNQ